jgi:translation elongation factor EF-G
VSGVKFTLHDGASHIVDSSDYSFQLAAEGAVKDGKYVVLVTLPTILKFFY